MTESQHSFTSFVQAALSGDIKRLRQILAEGFEVNQTDDEGESAFSWCCQKNVLASAKFLHAHGADVNAPLGGVSTPLDVAVCWASPEFRDWLRSVGGKRLKDFDEWTGPSPKDKQ
jgi:ankyrin repeat protein